MTEAAPIELAGMFLEWQRIEDAKADLADQSKALFKAAKDKGYDTKAMRAVFREKRVELEAIPEDVAKAEEAEAMNELYRSALDRGLTARARPAHDARENIEEFPSENLSYSQSGLTYAEEKGRGETDAKLIATVALGMQTEIGRKALVSALDIMIEREEAGELVQGMHEFDPETGELTDNQEQIGGNGTDLPVEASTDKQAAGASRPTNSNSQASSVPADSAGEAPSSSQASPATHSDDIDLTIPDFLRRTEGGYPKREAVEAH